jgi:hypothetical protein
VAIPSLDSHAMQLCRAVRWRIRGGSCPNAREAPKASEATHATCPSGTVPVQRQLLAHCCVVVVCWLSSLLLGRVLCERVPLPRWSPLHMWCRRSCQSAAVLLISVCDCHELISWLHLLYASHVVVGW